VDRDEPLTDQAERRRIRCASATQVLPQGQDRKEADDADGDDGGFEDTDGDVAEGDCLVPPLDDRIKRDGGADTGEAKLRRATLMLTLATIAVLVVASAGESKTVTCKSGQVCKGTNAADWIFGSPGNDNIRPMGGNDYVFGNGGADEVAHSYGDDRIFGGCGSDTVRGGFGLDRIFALQPIVAALYNAATVLPPSPTQLISTT
jgi:Ca2+-binding RTX toxin-like protein